MKNGVLFINKPSNMTSRDVVNKISKIYQTKKVGHTGTLDPLATGVLIVCLGSYTKLVNMLTSKEKTYETTMRLGLCTETGDITGEVIEEEESKVTKETIENTFISFPREYDQQVPIYSAVKINGKKLYEYARNNEKVQLPTRHIKISDLELLDIKGKDITFRTTVSKGTYIRSLIADLSKEMGEIATMTSLTRLAQGNYELSECWDLEQITKDTPLKKLSDLYPYIHYEISDQDYKKIQNGNTLSLSIEDDYVILTYQNKPIALYQKEDSEYKIIMKEME